ncbi:MAG: hypothetical protein AAFV31_15175 [Pseudomonadota bacterium]
MRQMVAGLAMLAAIPALAEDWRTLGGEEITAALTDRVLVYDAEFEVTQSFLASGRTEYTFGNPRWGWWDVRGDAYCSLWPPSDEWECFEIALNPDATMLRFIGAAGDITEGAFVE